MKFEARGSAQHFWLVSCSLRKVPGGGLRKNTFLRNQIDLSDYFLVFTRLDSFRRFGSDIVLDQKMQVW